MASVGEDFTLFELIAILGLIGAIGYGIYYVINNLPDLFSNLGIGAGAADPGGGAAATGILGSLDNMLEIGSSSESMSDATQTFFTQPVASVSAIVSGWWDDLTGGGSSSLTPTTDDGSFF